MASSGVVSSAAKQAQGIAGGQGVGQVIGGGVAQQSVISSPSKPMQGIGQCVGGSSTQVIASPAVAPTSPASSTGHCPTSHSIGRLPSQSQMVAAGISGNLSMLGGISVGAIGLAIVRDNPLAQVIGVKGDKGAALHAPQIDVEAREGVPLRYQCTFLCSTRLRVKDDMVNVGNANSPKYVCKACTSAKRSLELQIKPIKAQGPLGENARALEQTRRERPGEWAALVRSLRIREFDDEMGLGSKDEMSRAVAEYCRKVICEVKASHILGNVSWMDLEFYLGHCKQFTRWTPEEAEADYKAKIEGDWPRMGDDTFMVQMCPFSQVGHSIVRRGRPRPDRP